MCLHMIRYFYFAAMILVWKENNTILNSYEFHLSIIF